MNYFNKPVYKTLTQGAHKAQILGYKHVYEPQNNKDFMQLNLQFEDGRQQAVTYFPKGYDYMMNNLRRQSTNQDETFDSGYAFLDSLKGQVITTWVHYNEYGINFALHDIFEEAKQAPETPVSSSTLDSLLRL